MNVSTPSLSRWLAARLASNVLLKDIIVTRALIIQGKIQNKKDRVSEEIFDCLKVSDGENS